MRAIHRKRLSGGAGVFLLMACASTHEATREVRAAETREESTSSTMALAFDFGSTTTRGPVEVTTTTEDFFPVTAGGGLTPCDPLTCPDAGTVTQPAVKRRVVRVERRDPVVTDKRQEARAEAQASTEARVEARTEAKAASESTRSVGPPAWVWWAVPVGVFVVLSLGMWVKRRFSLWG